MIRPDWLTVASIATVAYALASIVHEGLGHGGACLAVGCVPQLVTTMDFQGNETGLSSAALRFIAAGGTLANLVAAAIAMLLLRRTRRNESWFFLWLFATVNLIQAAGYPLYSGVADIGDWAEIVHGLTPVWLWRASLVVVGATAYWTAATWSMRRLGQRLQGSGSARVTEAYRYTLVSYVTGGALSIIAGFFEPGGALLVLISGAAATLGGTSALAWGPQLLHGTERDATRAAPLVVQRAWRWVALAAAAAALFVFILGPGVRLPIPAAR